MGEPTIYKPSIYKGNGIYKNGADGGGGGGFEPVPNNIELHLYFEKLAGTNFHGPSINASLYDFEINNNNKIITDFEPKFDGAHEMMYVIQFQTSGSTNIECSIRDVTNYGRFEIYFRKIGTYPNYYDRPIKDIQVSTSDYTYFNRLIHVEITKDNYIFGEYSGTYDNPNKGTNQKVNLLAYNNIQQNFGHGTKFYPIRIYDENDNLLEVLYPAYKKDTGDKGFYSFALQQFFYNYVNTSKDNIGLGPVVPYFVP